MLKHIAAALVVIGSFCAAWARGEQAVVMVDVTPFVRTVQTYDPASPPSQMPAPEADEAGVTVADFSCAAVVDGRQFNAFRAGNDAVAGVTVNSVHITLRLYISEWVSAGAGVKTLAHEDGHGMIAQHFYQRANDIAAAIGREMIGRDFFGVGPDSDAAANDALNIAAQQIAQQYLKQMRDSSEKVQDEYDRITVHGTNSVEELEAIEQAMTQWSHGRLRDEWRSVME